MANDDELVEENLEEALEDIGDLADWSQGAVLWSTDWTAETIISQLNRSNIDLDPRFQRRSAWNDKKQSLFIESLILGLPIPQLILAEAPGRRGSFIVIDGKQRLLAIKRFGSGDAAVDFTPLKLSGLTELRRLNHKTYADIQGDIALSEDLSAFQNASIRTIVIRNWQNEGYLYEVFLRINTGSVQLSPQELRQALHPGPFSQFVSEASADSEEIRRMLNNVGPDFRMRDAELLLRYLAYKNYLPSYNGNLKQFLDESTRRLSSDWGAKASEVSKQVREMESALAFTREVFGERHYLRKWNGNEFETRKNRAVFDIMLYYFSQSDVRNALAGRGEEVKSAFVDLCRDDRFRSSLEATTKSIESNRIRINLWGEAVARLSGINLDALRFPG